ncbi:MAG: COX15/CtaA family protein [Parvibaculales bacterium]
MKSEKRIAYWLFALAGYVMLVVAIGGLTRLMDAGLSITEWLPITGIFPPLTENAWKEAFLQYQQIPEFQLINYTMSLAEFQHIYWWEWAHRMLARGAGLLFIFPFLWFWGRREIPKGCMKYLLLLFALGLSQGVLGWFMVKTGLSERVDVSPIFLMVHLLVALSIFSLSLWIGFSLIGGRILLPVYQWNYSVWCAVIIVILLFYQASLGALLAGMDGGKILTDWPFMDGKLIPNEMFVLIPFWQNIFFNPVLIQFSHRLIAYILIGIVIWQFYKWRVSSAKWLLYALLGQSLLGIFTLYSSVALWLGSLHQIMAVIVFGFSLWHLWNLLHPKRMVL